MVPSSDVELDPDLPPGFEYWVPTEEDIEDAGDGGLGYFHETWLLGEVPLQEARWVVAEEAELIDRIDNVAADDTEFDELASAVQWGVLEDDEFCELRGRPAWSALEDAMPGEEGISSHLELGVGGLAHALAAVGLVPVASCRGHSTSHAWSEAPVVFLATDRPRARVLQRLVAKFRCGLDHDAVNRPNFLIVTGSNIKDMNRLATAVLDAADEFGAGTIVQPGPRDVSTSIEVDPGRPE